MADYGSYTDEALIALIKKDDRGALSEIFTRYNQLLYAHAYNKLRNREEAMDVVQDLFIKIWNARYTMQISSNVSGYFYTMLMNGIFKLLSHKKVVASYATSYNRYRVTGECFTDHLVREKQLSVIIDKQIAALPPRMREIFELSRRDRLSNREIAQKLGLSEHTIADQIKKALRQLRTTLGLSFVLVMLERL